MIAGSVLCCDSSESISLKVCAYKNGYSHELFRRSNRLLCYATALVLYVQRWQLSVLGMMWAGAHSRGTIASEVATAQLLLLLRGQGVRETGLWGFLNVKLAT